MEEKIFLGVDPGRSKTGLALVDASGQIIDLHIAKTVFLRSELQNFLKKRRIASVILGNGTNSQRVAEEIQSVLPWVRQYFIDEAYSTEEARKLYWKINPPKGWRRLFPLSILVPPEPLDAYAAVIQVRRYLGFIE